MLPRLLLLMTAFISSQIVHGKDFIWYNGKEAISYAISPEASPVVKIALDMFAKDMKEVTGITPQNTSKEKATIRIIQLNKQKSNLAQELESLNLPLEWLTSKQDAFHIKVIGNSPQQQLLVVGSDARGTAYGILELSRLAGVSPWIWWGDIIPEKRTVLSIPADYSTMQSPSVKYRGIFINDEDWSFQPWSWRTFAPNKEKIINSLTYKEVFKLLLRLRANTIWPAMHKISTPFYQIPGAKEVADSCAIIIGTSHCEPLMRNNVREWDVKKQGRYNYITNRDSVQSYWIKRLQEVSNYENLYTIGMRGVHDGSMEGVKTLKEKTEALQQVINDQRKLLTQHINPDITKIPQVFVPYKEVLQIYESGLQVPDDITLLWCDDNYGYLTRLSDQEQQKRSGGAGIYYHLSYQGSPHDYLWLCTTQPGLIYNEMQQAYAHNVRREWIVNVHDPKLAAYNLELFLDMAWNINSVSASTLVNHYQQWLYREFGKEAGTKLLPAMLKYYRLCSIRKPEFMGTNSTELKLPKGTPPSGNTEFSFTAFGGEADRYMNTYDEIKQSIIETEKIISPSLKDAFFAHIKYPVFAAAAMSTKFLEAQRARMIASNMADTTKWKENKELMAACAKSINAYNEILYLTNYYNNEMSNGKWKYSMCHNPRKLSAFRPPILPLNLTEQDIKTYTVSAQKNDISSEIPSDKCIVYNACNYTHSCAKAVPIQTLGHSMKAVAIPQNGALTYEFNCTWEGEAILRTAVIPTHPNDKGDIRFSISIDGEKPQICSFRESYHSASWKRNVLRGQAIRETKHTLKKGKHTLTITALDKHVIVDQWMLDFKPERKFYVFPIDEEKN